MKKKNLISNQANTLPLKRWDAENAGQFWQNIIDAKVSIKQIPEGVFSSFANNVLQIKDSLLVGSPQGRFLYDPKGTSEKIVAFAAGSGITPIMSMIKTVLSSHPESEFSLVYGNKTPEDTMFLNELKELEKTFESRFKVTWVFVIKRKK